MLKNDLSFNKLAASRADSASRSVWSAPQATVDLGGILAVWVEQDSAGLSNASVSQPCPWLVLHGGPGGSLGSSHVAPLRKARLPWFGFDQRNSGLSEELDLSSIDLQRFVDDALDIADCLNIPKFHILGGSWGGTLALAIAAYRPERVASLVLRAPFVPLRSRVDEFFESLEQIAPDYFAEHFGPSARTVEVCEHFELGTPTQLLRLSVAWSKMEHMLLFGKHEVVNGQKPLLSDIQELALVRKYRLQAHFLKHDCFLTPREWHKLIVNVSQSGRPLSIIQGLKDRVCPPNGAKMISELIPRTTLIELPNTGHLAESSEMMTAIFQETARHSLMA